MSTSVLALHASTSVEEELAAIVPLLPLYPSTILAFYPSTLHMGQGSHRRTWWATEQGVAASCQLSLRTQFVSSVAMGMRCRGRAGHHATG